MTQLFSRARLLKHLKHGSKVCLSVLCTRLAPLSSEQVATLREQDRMEAATAWSKGLTATFAAKKAVRACGPCLKGAPVEQLGKVVPIPRARFDAQIAASSSQTVYIPPAVNMQARYIIHMCSGPRSNDDFRSMFEQMGSTTNGVFVLTIDRVFGPSHDMLTSKPIRDMMYLVSQNLAIAIISTPPRSTWYGAKIPPRSEAFPWGRPQCPPKLRDTVNQHNGIFRASLSVTFSGAIAGIPSLLVLPDPPPPFGIRPRMLPEALALSRVSAVSFDTVVTNNTDFCGPVVRLAVLVSNSPLLSQALMSLPVSVGSRPGSRHRGGADLDLPHPPPTPRLTVPIARAFARALGGPARSEAGDEAVDVPPGLQGYVPVLGDPYQEAG